MNKTLPIEIINKIRWFFYEYYFNSYYVINSNCTLYDEIFFIEAKKGNYFFGNDYLGKNI